MKEMLVYITILFMFFLFPLIKIFAQDGDLLIKQYNKGPSLENSYSRWTINPGIQFNRINADLQFSSPKITFGASIELEYNFSNSVGFSSGLIYSPISYSYPVKDTLGQDRLIYLTIPIIIRLKPTKRVNIGIGGLCNLYHKGVFSRVFDDVKYKELYEKDIFKNTIGLITQISYHFFKKCNVFVNYRWANGSSPPTQPETNRNSGFQLGLSYSLWKSRVRIK